MPGARSDPDLAENSCDLNAAGTRPVTAYFAVWDTT